MDNDISSLTPAYKRVLIKVSGEALMGDQPYGQDFDTIEKISLDIIQLVKMGVEVAVVVGGGNIFRGVVGAAKGMEQASADYMGMLATVMNALALQNMLEKHEMDTRVLSAISMMQICEPYIRRRALRHLERGRVVIFGAGTGNPFFTTDTAGTLRAIEMSADVILKATQVDGVYDADPRINPEAKRFETLSYTDVLVKDLKVMDASAISLARENNIPIIVFSIKGEHAITRAVCGQGTFTTVTR